MTIVNPIWLWGLLGLAIPIGIHLLSRKEGKTIYIGSLRHLIDSNTTRFSSLRLNEIILLVLRIALITIIIFLIAGLILPFENSTEKKWILVEKGIQHDSRIKPILDSLEEDNFQLRFFAKNFPNIDDSLAVEPVENYNSLLLDLAEQNINEVVVASYTLANHFKGNRISLPENFRWLSLEAPTKDFVVSAEKTGSDTLVVRSGKTNSAETFFVTRLMRSPQPIGDVFQHDSDTTKIAAPKSFTVNIQFDNEFERDANIIEASLNAIALEMHVPIKIEKAKTGSSQTNTYDLTFWLPDQPHVGELKNLIAFSSCGDQSLPILIESIRANLWCKGNSTADWILTRRLTQENVLEENFTLTLAKIIASKKKSLEDIFADNRALPISMAWSKSTTGAQMKSQAKSSIEPYLALLLLIILIAERFVAFKRNQ